jgi:hypothetical protein
VILPSHSAQKADNTRQKLTKATPWPVGATGGARQTLFNREDESMKMFKGPGFSRRNFLAGTGAAAAALSFGGRSASAAGQLNVYNWDTYIGETTLETFTASTGIEVQYDLYANLEEMFAKFQAGNPGYDVIFPSDYMMETTAVRLTERSWL